MPNWVDAAYAEYSKRLQQEWRCELIEIKAEKRESNKSTEALLKAEAVRIEPHWNKSASNLASYRILLDERGKLPSTLEFAQLLNTCFLEGKIVTFLIGGADGFAPSFLENTEYIMSLSKLTLPHSLARIILIEQIYRAMTVHQGHPYHRY